MSDVLRLRASTESELAHPGVAPAHNYEILTPGLNHGEQHLRDGSASRRAAVLRGLNAMPSKLSGDIINRVHRAFFAFIDTLGFRPGRDGDFVLV